MWLSFIADNWLPRDRWRSCAPGSNRKSLLGCPPLNFRRENSPLKKSFYTRLADRDRWSRNCRGWAEEHTGETDAMGGHRTRALATFHALPANYQRHAGTVLAHRPQPDHHYGGTGRCARTRRRRVVLRLRRKDGVARGTFVAGVPFLAVLSGHGKRLHRDARHI